MSSRLITLLEEVATAGTTKPQRIGRSPYANEPGSGDGMFESGAQLIYDIARAGTTGALTLYGMDAGDPNGSPSQLNSGVQQAQQFKGDGATTQFQSLIPFVALANNNHILTSSKYQTTSTATVTAGSNLVTGAASAFLTEFFVGQTILVNGEAKRVKSITSNTVLNTVENFAASAAGVSIFSVGSPLPAAAISAVTNVGGFSRYDLAVAPVLGALIVAYFGTPQTIYTGIDRAKRFQDRSYDFMWTLLGATPSAASLWASPVVYQ